jgi:hypothetical protein
MVTVTMPTHPFFGRKMAVEHVERGMRGIKFITVKHPFDGLLRLPMEWTDRTNADAPPSAHGIILKAGVRQLLLLAKACAAAEKNLDISKPKQTLTNTNTTILETKHGSKGSDSLSKRRAKPNAGKCLGHSRAPVHSKGLRRGEKR